MFFLPSFSFLYILLGFQNAESIKIDHEKKVAQLRKQEAKRAEHVKIEKRKKEIEKLENRMMVSAQSIETISEEIIRMREAELYPQLHELVQGLVLWLHLHVSCLLYSLCFHSFTFSLFSLCCSRIHIHLVSVCLEICCRFSYFSGAVWDHHMVTLKQKCIV